MDKNSEELMKKLINELLDMLRNYDFLNDIPKKDEKNAESIDKFVNMTYMEKYFAFKLEKKEYSLCNFDPDSSSKKLQQIYRILWKSNVLALCEKEGAITGDTMNSVAKSLNRFVNAPNDSTEQCWNKWKSGEEKEKEKFKYKPLVDFVNSYHKLGNFMPVPHNDFNRTKCWKTKDFFDDTLFCIYQWYKNNNSTECEWLNEFSGWLNAFGSWKAFVKQNFLEDFVDENLLPFDLFSKPDSNQKTPTKSLEASHGLPNKNDEFKDVKLKNFFENAAYCINKRTERMIEALRKRFDEFFD